VNLSIDKTFVQRLGHRVFVCRRLQGFTRSAKKLFAQSNRGSLIGRQNLPSALEDNTHSSRLQTNQRWSPERVGIKLLQFGSLAFLCPILLRSFVRHSNRPERVKGIQWTAAKPASQTHQNELHVCSIAQIRNKGVGVRKKDRLNES